MKAHSFDVSLDFPAKALVPAGGVFVVFQGRSVPASVVAYRIPQKDAALARVTPDKPLEVRWMDVFEVRTRDGRLLGRATVLDPSPPDPAEVKLARKKDLLGRLGLGEREMILVLAELKGIHGLTDEEIAGFSRLGRARIEALARDLEEAGRVRILSFSPLVLVLQASLDFLRRRIAAFLAQYQKRHPGERGAAFETIARKFEVAPNILHLAVRALVKQGKVTLEGGLVGLVDFRVPLSPADEIVLGEMEAMFLKGEFGQVSLDEIRKRLHLGPGKLQTLLAVLAERKKIVEGRDGFILHSRWLEDVVKKIHASGKKELTVADFKGLTGLTRKYAIPLLELLDEMGITRRKGAVRDILK